MSEDRKISVARARITRPVAAQPRADDTDENEPVRPPSVQRVRTPADVTLEALIADLEGKGVPPEIALALEAIARRGFEDRARLEAKLQQATRKESRWSRIFAIAKTISAGTVLAALLSVGSALMSHGDAQAVARQHAEKVGLMRADVEALKFTVETLRAQLAAVQTILLPSARLSAPVP